MNKIVHLGICLIVMLFSVNVAFADDPIDNWCDPGGKWDDGRCVNDWFWECGWMMAHYEQGMMTRPQIESSACWTLLPPKPVQPATIVEISPGVCAIVYSISTTTVTISADWGTPVAGQDTGFLLYNAVGDSIVLIQLPIPSSSTSLSWSDTEVPFAQPIGTPGTFRLLNNIGISLYGPIACPTASVP